MKGETSISATSAENENVLSVGDIVCGNENSDFGFTQDTRLEVLDVDYKSSKSGDIWVRYIDGPASEHDGENGLYKGPLYLPKCHDNRGWLLFENEWEFIKE